jgi:hypothetical protein
MALLTPEQLVQLEGYIVRLRQIAKMPDGNQVNFGNIPRIVGEDICHKHIDMNSNLRDELIAIIDALDLVANQTRMGQSVTIPQDFDRSPDSRGISSGSCR